MKFNKHDKGHIPVSAYVIIGFDVSFQVLFIRNHLNLLLYGDSTPYYYNTVVVYH